MLVLLSFMIRLHYRLEQLEDISHTLDISPSQASPESHTPWTSPSRSSPVNIPPIPKCFLWYGRRLEQNMEVLSMWRCPWGNVQRDLSIGRVVQGDVLGWRCWWGSMGEWKGPRAIDTLKIPNCHIWVTRNGPTFFHSNQMWLTLKGNVQLTLNIFNVSYILKCNG